MWMWMRTQVNKLESLDTFMKDISAGLDAEVPEGPEGKANLMKVRRRLTSNKPCGRRLGLILNPDPNPNPKSDWLLVSTNCDLPPEAIRVYACRLDRHSRRIIIDYLFLSGSQPFIAY